MTQQANISIKVMDLASGEVIDSYRAEQVVAPASVMKLVTTGAALETLGPDFRFTTTLEHDGFIRDGVLYGSLFIRGGCDPSLGTRINQAGRMVQQTGFLRQWVQAIQAAGIRRITGSIIADMSMLDGDAQNPAWLCEDTGNWYAPGVFSLNYLGNTMNIVLRSSTVGSVAEVIGTDPVVPGLVFNNHIRCTSITEDGAYVHGLPYSHERYLTGSVPSNRGSFGVRGDIPNPGLLLARHLYRELMQAGVDVGGEPAYLAEVSPLLPSRTVLYEHKSAPLSAIVAETNIHSNNLYAESIFRYMGVSYGSPGTIHNSAETVRECWRRKGISIRGSLIKDGCGLAPQDAVSAETFVQILSYMSTRPTWEAWYKSLPVSGESGTLRSFLDGTELQGRVHAKSGTIAGTKNFAGYIDLPDGRRWAFAVLVSGAQGKARAIQPVIEQYLLDVYRTHP